MSIKKMATYSAKNKYMQAAIDQAREGIYAGHGGPFGSVIVKDNKIIAQGHNKVLLNNDSTAHGEIVTIRLAEQALQTYDLTGCDLYTTGEPCPMCLAACLWANINHVYYGCTIADNSKIGFRDETMDNKLGGRKQVQDYLDEINREACLKLFEEYNSLDKVIY